MLVIRQKRKRGGRRGRERERRNKSLVMEITAYISNRIKRLFIKPFSSKVVSSTRYLIPPLQARNLLDNIDFLSTKERRKPRRSSIRRALSSKRNAHRKKLYICIYPKQRGNLVIASTKTNDSVEVSASWFYFRSKSGFIYAWHVTNTKDYFY